MSLIYGIDPGPVQSALVVIEIDPFAIKSMIMLPNETMSDMLKSEAMGTGERVLAIEYLQSYGSQFAVSRELIDTANWVGWFTCIWGYLCKQPYTKHLRTQIKAYIVGSVATGDKSVSNALKMRFGAPGNKKNPGILYGIKKDLWSALAVAVYHMDGAKLGEWQ